MKLGFLIGCTFAALSFWAAPLHGAIIFLTAKGTVSESSSQGTDFGSTGEPFQISISYQSDLNDADPTSFFGQYFDDDLSVTLEFLESGQTLHGRGGSVNVNSLTGPNGSNFVAEILILSKLSELGAFFFGFQDGDGSEIRDTEIPTNFSNAEDYDFVGFSVLDLSLRIGGTAPIPPLIEGEVTFVALPEPSCALLTATSLLCLFRRQR